MAEQNTHPFPLYVVWGETPDPESTARVDFASERERSAYIAGIEDADGWLGAAWNPKADWMLKFLEVDCSASDEHLEQAREKFETPAPFGEPLPPLSVEVAAVYRYEGRAVCRVEGPEELWRAEGFAVYIRNPFALCVADFWLPDWMPSDRWSIEAAKRSATRFAGVLAEHLHCSVVYAFPDDIPAEHVARPRPFSHVPDEARAPVAAMQCRVCFPG